MQWGAPSIALCCLPANFTTSQRQPIQKHPNRKVCSHYVQTTEAVGKEYVGHPVALAASTDRYCLVHVFLLLLRARPDKFRRLAKGTWIEHPLAIAVPSPYERGEVWEGEELDAERVTAGQLGRGGGEAGPARVAADDGDVHRNVDRGATWQALHSRPQQLERASGGVGDHAMGAAGAG